MCGYFKQKSFKSSKYTSTIFNLSLKCSCVWLFSMLSDGGPVSSTGGALGAHLPVDRRAMDPTTDLALHSHQAERSSAVVAKLAAEQGDFTEADGGRACHRDGSHSGENQTAAGIIFAITTVPLFATQFAHR